MSDDAQGPVDRRDQRAADVDRKLIADRLRKALDEGRLDLSEYDERVAVAYQAKTYGELDDLLLDIPDVAPASRSQLERAREATLSEPEKAAKRRNRRRKDLRGIWSGFGGALIFFTGVWAIGWVFSGNGPTYYWPAWVVGFWAVGALVATWNKFMDRD